MPSFSFNMADFALNYDATLRLFDSEGEMKHISLDALGTIHIFT